MEFQEFTVLHLQHPVSAGGDFGVVGVDDDAVVFVVGQILENLHNVTAVFRVQISGGLVGQDQLTAGGQGSGDGHPLLLTAGEHIGKTPELILFQPQHIYLFQVYSLRSDREITYLHTAH